MNGSLPNKNKIKGTVKSPIIYALIATISIVTVYIISQKTVAQPLGDGHRPPLSDNALITTIQLEQTKEYKREGYKQVRSGDDKNFIKNQIFDYRFKVDIYRKPPYRKEDTGYQITLYEQIGTTSTGTPIIRTRSTCVGPECENKIWDWK